MKATNTIVGLMFAASMLSACAGSGSVRQDPEDRVNIGYGDIHQDNVTGTITSIDSDDIERRRVTELAQLFEGHPGVQVIHTPDGFRLQVRGIHSFSSGRNSPLFVLDGTPLQTGPAGIISFINPHDVERIDILKGAAAAIYGTRGANGVVLIKTKRVR